MLSQLLLLVLLQLKPLLYYYFIVLVVAAIAAAAVATVVVAVAVVAIELSHCYHSYTGGRSATDNGTISKAHRQQAMSMWLK